MNKVKVGLMLIAIALSIAFGIMIYGSFFVEVEITGKTTNVGDVNYLMYVIPIVYIALVTIGTYLIVESKEVN